MKPNSAGLFFSYKKTVAALVMASGSLGWLWLYWRFQKPFAGFTWKEAILFLVFAYAIATGICFLLQLIFTTTRETKLKTLLAVSSVFFMLLNAEIILRIAGINRVYIETRGGRYSSAFIRRDSNVNRTYGPGTTTYIESLEFKYPRYHNNLGFSDSDFIAKTDSTQTIIQTYGDSFTEGDGAPADSTYPALLRTFLKRGEQNRITVQNFGICGNDPGFYWKQFKDIGSPLQPDLAVFTYGTGDFTTDFLTKGGLERFKDGYYEGFKGPRWEWLYACSYVFRLFVHSLSDVSYNNFFLTDAEKATRLRELEPKWNQTFLAIGEVARKKNIKVLLIKKPERSEIELNHYDYDFSVFEKIIDTVKLFTRYDLLPYYRDSAGINNSNSIFYYWLKDGHHNSAGYSVMAKGVHAGLKKCYPDLVSISDSVR